MAKRTYIIRDEQSRKAAAEMCAIVPLGSSVDFKDRARTVDQNSRMWAMLTEISDQAEHLGRRHTPETWKFLFMNAMGYEARFLIGLNMEPFPVGLKTSRLTVKQMVGLQDFIQSWADQNGIRFKADAGIFD